MFRSLLRSWSLEGMSKGVPKVGESRGQIVGLSAQFRVHAGSFGGNTKPPPASSIFYDGNLPKVVQGTTGTGGRSWPGSRDGGCSLPAAAAESARRRRSSSPDRKSTRLNSSHLGISYA